MISILGIYMLVLFILSAFLFTYTIDRNINTHIRIACFVNFLFCAVMLRRMFIINDDISRFILLDKFMLQLIPIVMVVLFIVVRDKRAFTTNSSAIKESFDSMSDGICFASLGGTPLLVNKVMNNFAEMISGEQIMNANVFYDALLSGDYDLSVLRKEPTINIKCGDRVYNFNRKVISVGDEEVYEMTLTDITKQYELNLQLNNDKKRLDNLNLKLKKMSKAEIDKKVKRVLEMVDLEGFEKRKVQTLSGGQQQRIAIARALVNEPEILLLDEPLGALDLKMRKEMQLELISMHEKLGITFIYVTHDQEEALTMSDKIVVMSEGKMQQIGTPEDIYNEPKNAFVADFIGESNIFKGIMTGHMKVRFCGGEFEGMDDVPEGTLVDVVIRPEDVIITKPEDGTVVGEVTSVIFKGMHYEVAVESGKYEMIIRTTKCYHVGDTVGMQLEPDGIHVMLAEDHTTSFVTTINGDYTLDFNGKIISCDLTQVIPKTKMSDGVLVDENGENVDVSKFRVVVSIQPDDIEMSDDVTAGLVSGKIINLIYKGDHYSYVIRTEYGHDLIVDDEYLWNMDDQVGLIMPEEKMKFQLKK